LAMICCTSMHLVRDPGFWECCSHKPAAAQVATKHRTPSPHIWMHTSVCCLSHHQNTSPLLWTPTVSVTSPAMAVRSSCLPPPKAELRMHRSNFEIAPTCIPIHPSQSGARNAGSNALNGFLPVHPCHLPELVCGCHVQHLVIFLTEKQSSLPS